MLEVCGKGMGARLSKYIVSHNESAYGQNHYVLNIQQVDLMILRRDFVVEREVLCITRKESALGCEESKA